VPPPRHGACSLSLVPGNSAWAAGLPRRAICRRRLGRAPLLFALDDVTRLSSNVPLGRRRRGNIRAAHPSTGNLEKRGQNEESDYGAIANRAVPGSLAGCCDGSGGSRDASLHAGRAGNRRNLPAADQIARPVEQRWYGFRKSRQHWQHRWRQLTGRTEFGRFRRAGQPRIQRERGRRHWRRSVNASHTGA
jgi:hypothetical protein